MAIKTFRIARNEEGDIIGHTYRAKNRFCFFDNRVIPKKSTRCFKTIEERKEFIKRVGKGGR